MVRSALCLSLLLIVVILTACQEEVGTGELGGFEPQGDICASMILGDDFKARSTSIVSKISELNKWSVFEDKKDGKHPCEPNLFLSISGRTITDARGRILGYVVAVGLWIPGYSTHPNLVFATSANFDDSLDVAVGLLDQTARARPDTVRTIER